MRRGVKARKKALERQYRTRIRALRAECPTAMGYPVEVRRTSVPGPEYGWCDMRDDGESFRIVLRTHVKVNGEVRAVTEGEMRETLIHEWAHAMSWTPEHHSFADHDAAWGVRYAQAYNAVVED